MAYLISGVDEDVVHAASHGVISRDNLRFLRNRADRIYEAAGGVVSKYFAAAKDALDKFDLSGLRDRVESLRDRHERRNDHDRIVRLVDLSDFQNAKPTMRNIIMAHPRYRKLWQQGRADGFGELYHDDEPGVLGRYHSIYREIYNGSNDKTVLDEEHFVTYFGVDDEHGEAAMKFGDRVISRDVHDRLDDILDQGKQDPGSILRKTL